jgi:hypothetical protein
MTNAGEGRNKKEIDPPSFNPLDPQRNKKKRTASTPPDRDANSPTPPFPFSYHHGSKKKTQKEEKSAPDSAQKRPY